MMGHSEHGRLPRVLLLGDSIRQGKRGYQPLVRDLLKGSAEVVGPEVNCGTSAQTLAMLPEWLAQFGKPDVVHWNNGLHDSAHMPPRDPVQYTVEAYVETLKAILAYKTPACKHKHFVTTASLQSVDRTLDAATSSV